MADIYDSGWALFARSSLDVKFTRFRYKGQKQKRLLGSPISPGKRCKDSDLSEINGNHSLKILNMEAMHKKARLKKSLAAFLWYAGGSPAEKLNVLIIVALFLIIKRKS